MVNINLVDYEVTNPPYKVKNATFAYNRGNENVLQVLHSDRIQETKAVTFDHNDTYEVAPDEGFDAIRKAEVTVNVEGCPAIETLHAVSSPWTTNGTYNILPSSGYFGMQEAKVTTEINKHWYCYTNGASAYALFPRIVPTDGSHINGILFSTAGTSNIRSCQGFDASGSTNITIVVEGGEWVNCPRYPAYDVTV